MGPDEQRLKAHIAALVRWRRSESGLDLAAFAAALGVRPRWIEAWEAGKIEPWEPGEYEQGMQK